MKVKLTYFRASGKYYSSGSYKTENQPIHMIVEEVKRMNEERTLPDLVKGHSSCFIVLVEVPRHPHNHPHLIGVF